MQLVGFVNKLGLCVIIFSDVHVFNYMCGILFKILFVVIFMHIFLM